MRYPASEKLEIIRLVEQSHLPVRRTLEKLGILPGSFYRWVDRYQTGGIEALEDKPSKPSRVWNRIPDDVRRTILEMALDEPELSPRELAARFTRRLRSDDVLHCLTELMGRHGPPEHIRSDNGPEFVARNVRSLLIRLGVKTLYIGPGSPWENCYCESFNSKLRDELLECEQFSTLYEAQVLIERWRRHYNTIRPHSSLGYRPPAPETILPPASGLAYAPLRPAQILATSGRVLT